MSSHHTQKDAERVKHGPHCRTHMAASMPTYGSDCTCGGDWTPARQLEALIYRVISPGLDHYDAEKAARYLVESGLVVAAPGTLAASAATSVIPPGANETQEGVTSEQSGEKDSAWIVTCDDLGCKNGKTIQGRKYHPDGRVDEQWAPCGRQADTCPILPGTGDTDV